MPSVVDPLTPAADRHHVSRRGLLSGGWRALALVAIIGTAILLEYAVIHRGNLMYDFKGGLYDAGVAILHGHGFYRPGFLAHQAAIMRAGGVARGELDTNPFSLPVYPAFANLLVVPLALMPLWAASCVYTLLSIAAMLAGLWLLGVRDWRCLVVALTSWPFVFGAMLGAVGPFLVLGAGIAWRWRDRIWAPAVAIAAIVAVKIFPWPLGVWLLITRRWKAAFACAAAGVAITVGAWAVIGFSGMSQYPQMLSNMSFIQDDRAVSLVTALLVLGVSQSLATVLAMLATGAILVLAWRLSRGRDGDRRAFGLAVIAALTSTPIVWEHYMVLLFVPIALASPGFSRLWLLPLVTPVTVFLVDVLGLRAADRPFSVNSLRSSLIWLAIEVTVGVWLCTTAEQRQAAWARVRARVAGVRLGLHGEPPATTPMAPELTPETLNA